MFEVKLGRGLALQKEQYVFEFIFAWFFLGARDLAMIGIVKNVYYVMCTQFQNHVDSIFWLF